MQDTQAYTWGYDVPATSAPFADKANLQVSRVYNLSCPAGLIANDLPTICLSAGNESSPHLRS